jgi:hypothetical protein
MEERFGTLLLALARGRAKAGGKRWDAHLDPVQTTKVPILGLLALAVRIHWEALNILKSKSKILIRFWKNDRITP